MNDNLLIRHTCRPIVSFQILSCFYSIVTPYLRQAASVGKFMRLAAFLYYLKKIYTSALSTNAFCLGANFVPNCYELPISERCIISFV